MLIAVGRLELRPEANRLWFGILTWLALRQALRAPGCRHATARSENDRVYWSLSAWQTAEAMRAYRNSGAHQRAMRAFARRSTGRFVHWQAESVPDWPEAMRRAEAADSAQPSTAAAS